MKVSLRLTAAIGIFVLLGLVVALGHWRETQAPPPLPVEKAVVVHVTNPATEGPARCAKPCSSWRPPPARAAFPSKSPRSTWKRPCRHSSTDMA
jgi:hypothetical protein